MDEAMLRARLEDAVRLSHKGARYIGFLDPAEAQLLAELTHKSHEAEFRFWGGFPHAERQILAVHQVWDEPVFPIEAVTLTFREQDVLSHRDFLGSLMAQGVTRGTLGDILTEPGRAVVFAKPELTAYFLETISKVGRVGVRCCLGAREPLPQAHSFLEESGVIASDRLDCFVAFLMRSSREKAVTAIQTGLVTVNYRQADSVSARVSAGDVISVRYTGKFIVDRVGPLTKKGRLSVGCRKYI